MMYKEVARIDKSLRDYQQNAKESIFAFWDIVDNVMFQMPTGTGKTRLFTSIICDIKTWSIYNKKNLKILIIAHRVELIEQISNNLIRYKIQHGIIAGGKPRNLRCDVQVASIQTITHRTNIDVAESLKADFIIIDEAHHSTANSYKKLWNLYPKAKKLGVTATPWRMNHIGFTSIYEKLIVSDSINCFIKQGWLAPFSYYSIKSSNSIAKQIKKIDEFDIEGDYKLSALERTIDQTAIRAQLLDSYLKYAKGKKGIIYSISRKHSEHICSEYKEVGINIVRIDSETPKEERQLHVQRFKKGLIDIIVNVDIFSEGFDCPDIEFIQLARPTKSLVKYLQQVGRGLRPIPNKDKCLILDNVGSFIEFGLPNSDRDWEKEFYGYKLEKIETPFSQVESLGEREPKSFEEGCDELCLIEDIEYADTISKTKTDSWSESDDNLLKTLIERECPIEVIASVFKKDVEEMKTRVLKYITEEKI